MKPRNRKGGTRRGGPRWGVVITAAVAGVVVLLVAFSHSQALSDRAPDFRMEVYRSDGVIGEGQTTFHTVLGQGKPVVLNFWAGQCPPCRAEMPGFQRLYDAYDGKFTMLGVDVGPYVGLGTTRDALNFLEEFSITYPTAKALTSSPLSDYGVRGMPTTVFLTSDGKVLSTRVGFLTEGQAESELRKVLAASGVES